MLLSREERVERVASMQSALQGDDGDEVWMSEEEAAAARDDWRGAQKRQRRQAQSV